MNLLQRHLRKMDACQDAIDWAEAYPGRDGAKRAWNECQNGEWMLWYASKVYKAYTNSMRLAACEIARTVLIYVPGGEERPLKAIETAERYARAILLSST